MQNVLQKNRMVLLELAFWFLAVLVGAAIVYGKYSMLGLIAMALVGLGLLRLALKEPFYKTLTVYMGLVAFNYYYFYCSALTGRNPTDFPAVGGLPATQLELAQKDIFFAIILGVAIMKLFNLRFQGKEILKRRLDHPLIKLIGIWIIYCAIRTFFILLEGDTLFNVLHYLRSNTEFALLPFLLLTVLITRKKHFNVIFKGLLYTLPIVAALGVVEFMLEGSVYVKNFSGAKIYRVTSTLQNPNNLGAYLTTTIGIYIIYYLRHSLSRFERWWFWPVIGVSAACLFMTLSRSSILTFFITLPSIVALHYLIELNMGRFNKRNFTKVMGLILAGIGISLFILFRYFDFGNALEDATEVYLSYNKLSAARSFALILTTDYLLQHPLGLLFGLSKASASSLVDNSFAEILMRSGLIGFILFISMFILGFRSCLRGIFQNRKHQVLYMICFYILSSQLIYSLSSSIIFNYPHYLYFWFTLGVLAIIDSQDAEETEAAPSVSEAKTELPADSPQPRQS